MSLSRKGAVKITGEATIAETTAAETPVLPIVRSARTMRRKRAPKALGPALLVIAVVAVAAYLVWSAVKPASSSTRYVTGTVERGTLTVAASGNGSVVVGKASSVSPQVSGVVADLAVSVGSTVTAGQTLFTIVNDQLDDQVQSALAQYKNSQASYIRAQQSVTQAEQSLSQAKLSLAKAQQDYDKASNSPSTTANDRDNAASQVDIATKGVEAANQGLDAAESSLSAARTSKSSSYNGYQQAIKTAAKRKVTAPISGIVTRLGVQDGDGIGSGSSGSSSGGSSSGGSSQGGSSSSSSSSGGSSSASVVISDMGSLQAQVSVSEVDRAKVKLGQKATLTFDAISDLTQTGKVTSIDAVGTNSSGVVTYNVTIAFDAVDPRINPGMTTAAAITTDVRTGVLSVPRAAVKSDTNGGYYVLVMQKNATTPSRVTVETGVSTDSNTEITSGLNEGDTIVTQSITPNSTGSSSGSSGNRGVGGFGGMGGGVRMRVGG